GAAVDLARRLGAPDEGALHQRGLDGEAVRLRGVQPRRQGGSADPRRLRLHQRVHGRAAVPRRAHHRDLRRDLGDPAPGDRQDASQGRGRVSGAGKRRDGTTVVHGRRGEWEETVLKPSLAKKPERDVAFTTVSDLPIERLYTPEDLEGWDAERDLGLPGEPPYTRGLHPTMYRGRLWTMRQFAGFGSAE